MQASPLNALMLLWVMNASTSERPAMDSVHTYNEEMNAYIGQRLNVFIDAEK